MRIPDKNTAVKGLLIATFSLLALTAVFLGIKTFFSEKTGGEERLVISSLIPSFNVELVDKDRAIAYLNNWAVYSDNGVFYYDTNTQNAGKANLSSIQIMLTQDRQIAGELSSKISDDYATVSSFSTDTDNLDRSVLKILLFVNTEYLKGLETSQRDILFSNILQQELYMVFHPYPATSYEKAREELTLLREEVLRGPVIYRAVIE